MLSLPGGVRVHALTGPGILLLCRAAGPEDGSAPQVACAALDHQEPEPWVRGEPIGEQVHVRKRPQLGLDFRIGPRFWHVTSHEFLLQPTFRHKYGTEMPRVHLSKSVTKLSFG